MGNYLDSSPAENLDQDFEKELASLGVRPGGYAETPMASSSSLQEKIASLGSIGEIDENSIFVTEEDLNDPEFLQQIESFNLPGHGGTSRSLQEEDATDSKAERVQRIKAEAVQLKKEGRQAEALSKYREAKVIEEEEGVLERRVEAVRTIARTPTQPSYASPTSIPSNEIRIEMEGEEPRGTAEEAKTMAVLLKKEGRVEEALRWLRYAKVKSSDSTSPMSSSNSSLMKAYQSLETNLREAMRLSLEEAKRLRLVDQTEALSMMRRYKDYEAQLQTLSTYRSSKCPPPCPSFHWETIKREISLQIHQDLGEDSIVISIGSISNAADILSKHIGQQISIHYNLSIPLDNPAQGSTSKIRISKEDLNNLVIGYSARHEVHRRKSFSTTLMRKRMRIEVVVHRGFLLKGEILAIANVPLQDLIQNNVCAHDQLPLCNESGKVIGGCMSSQLRIRYPYNGGKKLMIEEKVLEVEPWTATPLKAPMHVTAQATLSKDVSKDEQFETLTAKEKEDPLNVEYYVSNDVLENELERIDNEISKSENEDMIFDSNFRRNLLHVKLNSLVGQVQSEELSMSDYLTMLHSRLAKDKLLALYLNSCGRKTEALLVMKRILVMDQEIKGAEESDTL